MNGNVATFNNRFGAALDDARLLIQYDPAVLGPAQFDLDLTNGMLQGLVLCGEEQSGTGVFEIPIAGLDGDLDGDGFGSCSNNDCNDSDPLAYPGAPELCDAVDNDCDLLVDEDFDLDGDGVPTCGNDGIDATTEDNDCDDTNPDIAPGIADLCDGLDNDCNGTVDDAYADIDGDGVPDLSLIHI